jgi:hypothetical protein
MYSVSAQMGRITQAVSFMMSNLERQGAIPPYPGLDLLKSWQEPQRDVELLQGWRAAEAKREEMVEDARAGKRSRNTGGGRDASMDMEGDRRRSTQFEGIRESAYGYNPPPLRPRRDSTMTADHSDQHIPAQPHLTPISETLDGQSYYARHPPRYADYYDDLPPPPPPIDMPVGYDYSEANIPIPHLPPVTDLHTHLPPIPAALTSPSVSFNSQIVTPQTQTTRSPSMYAATGTIEELRPSLLVEGGEESRIATLQYDEEGDVVYGCEDHRSSIVNKKIVTALEAKQLVK